MFRCLATFEPVVCSKDVWKPEDGWKLTRFGLTLEPEPSLGPTQHVPAHPKVNSNRVWLSFFFP